MSQSKEGTMETEVTATTQNGTVTRSVLIFLAGAVVGAAAALLLAPQTGQASRKQLRRSGRRTGETVSDWMARGYAALLDFAPLDGLLLGAIVSSTDAAAVFAVLRSRQARLRGQLTPLLELESGSNDLWRCF
jgi:hypothetical protein